jgi:cytochrome c5
MSDSHAAASAEEHSSFIKTPGQLITVVVLSFVIPIFIIVLLAKLVTTSNKFGPDHPAMSDEAVAARIKPIGQVALVDASAPKVIKSGKEVVEQACAACHSTGALNAAKIGDSAAWGKLAKAGLEQLTASAVKGVRQMPAKGGNPDLSELEIARAIAYMVNQSGGSMKEPEAPAAAPAPAAEKPAEKK